MAAIYMFHDRHGNKVACSEEEAKLDEANGWKRYDVAALLKPSSDAAPVDEELSKLRVEYQAKFGKAPHHKKSADTLKAELS